MALVFYPCELVDTTTLPPRPQVLYSMLGRFLTAGWTCIASGDAFSLFSTTGNIFTNAGTGAGGMGNTGAYFVVRMPGASNRQLLFELNQANTPLWIKYSFSAGFSGGGVSVIPTATDQRDIIGSTALGGGQAMFVGGSGNCRVSMAFDNAAPYGWWMICHRIVSTHIETLLAMDPIATGTGLIGDLDPYLFLAAFGASGTGLPFYNGNTWLQPACGAYPLNIGQYGCTGWKNKGYVGEAWASFAWHSLYAYPNKPALNLIGTNPSNSKDMLVNVPYMVANPPQPAGGWKGVSSLFWFVTTDRGIGDDFTIVSARDYRSVGGMAVKWNGSIPVIV